jgi:multiple sugar transport system permease protein/raffinose/stachyose/melibiose transport system permease protein
MHPSLSTTSSLASHDRLGQRAQSLVFSRQEGLLFILPALLFFALFVLYPIVYIVRASLLEWDGLSTGTWVGLDNYRQLFTADPIFLKTLRNAVLWSVLTIVPQMLLGFGLAVLLNGPIVGRTIYRAIFYLPAIVSPIVVGIVWQRIYNPFGGLLSDAARQSGLHWLAQPYLADPTMATYAAIAVNVWQWTGFSMLLYLAGLQGLPGEVLEAATIDGATRWQRLRQVVWPMLRPVHLTLILLGIIGALQTFALVFILTKGGPNNASQTLPTYIFQQAFQLSSMGYGAAISVVLLAIALIASLGQMRFLGSRFVVGEGD